MKVLLIQPPMVFPRGYIIHYVQPLGIAYLASALRGGGVEVEIIDAFGQDIDNKVCVDGNRIIYGLSEDKIKVKIRDFQPDIVGITCLFANQEKQALRISELVKGIPSEVITVLGGCHPTAIPGKILQNRNVDFIVLGEGERTFLSLVQHIENKSDVKCLPGLVFRAGNGGIINTGKAKLIPDIDTIPFPARDLLPMENYFSKNIPHGGLALYGRCVDVITSRGCPQRCIFCCTNSFWGRRFRGRSPKNILSELKYVKKEYGVKEVAFVDDNLTLDKERAIQLFTLMKKETLNLPWSTPQGVAVQTLDDRMIDEMCESGCYWVSLGIESGVDRVLREAIHKRVDLSSIKGIIKRFRRHKTKVSAFFVIGLPGESISDIKRTFAFARSLDLDTACFSFVTPYPGSELYGLCKDKGYFINGYDYSYAEYKNPSIATEEFDRETLLKVVARERLKSDLLTLIRRPKMIVSRARPLLGDMNSFFTFVKNTYLK